MKLHKKTEPIGAGCRLECQVDEQGRKQSEACIYNQKGDMINCAHYKDDKLDGVSEDFDKKGNLARRQHYKNGELVSEDIEVEMAWKQQAMEEEYSEEYMRECYLKNGWYDEPWIDSQGRECWAEVFYVDGEVLEAFPYRISPNWPL